MTLDQIVISILFLVAFAAIIFEHPIKVEKFKTSVFFAVIAWIYLWIQGYMTGPNEFKKIEHAFHEYILEIAVLWLFLICAMTFVAYLDKRGWIEKTVLKYLPERISVKKFLFLIGGFTFFFSGIADNLTATLVALTIVMSVMYQSQYKNQINAFGVFVVFAANAGGLPLITGDVTTLMIFVAGKVTMIELLELYIPAFVTFFVLYLFLVRGLEGDIIIKKDNLVLESIDTKIAILFIITIIAILAGHVLYHLPPVLVFLLGLSVMFLMLAHEKRKTQKEIRVLDYVQHCEFDALFFFLGVLLLVGALKEVGVLSQLVVLYELVPHWFATYLIGISSAFVDNIPITAAMLKADLTIDDKGWMLMTYAVGIGGSLLVIGSAAGIVAASKIKSLTFGAYLKFTPIIWFVYTLGYVTTYVVSVVLSGRNIQKTEPGGLGFLLQKNLSNLRDFFSTFLAFT